MSKVLSILDFLVLSKKDKRNFKNKYTKPTCKPLTAKTCIAPAPLYASFISELKLALSPKTKAEQIEYSSPSRYSATIPNKYSRRPENQSVKDAEIDHSTASHLSIKTE